LTRCSSDDRLPQRNSAGQITLSACHAHSTALATPSSLRADAQPADAAGALAEYPLMQRPVAIFLAMRYLRERGSNQFASFVTTASVAGVALGVAALIVVLSVMNGTETETRGRLVSIAGHASVVSDEVLSGDWRPLRADLERYPGIAAAAPFVELEAMLSTGRSLEGALLIGVDPAIEDAVSGLAGKMREGELAGLAAQERGVLLGRALALRLGLQTGDAVTVMVPRRTAGGAMRTGLREFTVTGIFEFGLAEYDSLRAFVTLDDAGALAGSGTEAGIRVRMDDIFAAGEVIRGWAATRRQAAPRVRDWTQDNATFFRAVRIEKIMMTLLLSLIVAVAAFNIVATLVMIVTDKRAGIAIMRTYGFTRRTIMAAFALQGLIVGWMGVLLGVGMGVLLALNIRPASRRITPD
jgi:lipoprotein-releasing system permease protein